ncbi:hypothetical protein PHMEG_0005542, partial [Phytophthora megakarya]
RFECNESKRRMFDLEHRGNHSEQISSRKRKGIHLTFKVEVDTAVLSGGTQAKVKLRLEAKYQDQELLTYMPSELQIKNRKSHLTRQLEKQTKITTFAELNEWASLRLCTTSRPFLVRTSLTEQLIKKLLQSTSRIQQGTLVLNVFHHQYKEDNTTKTSFGFVMTSRRSFRNVRCAVEGQQSDGLFAAADGTYRLHYDAFDAEFSKWYCN